MARASIYGTSLVAIGWLCSGSAAAQSSPPKSLADASLEELMNVEVTSASKKTQRLASTAASVYVISAEDIRRSGITVLPELLRLAPGVQVARLSSGSWAIGIRGFNDEFSNKLLVLVDGRSVYNEFYAGTFWDTLGVSVDDLERIEVIRGPGAAMWGTNAVNGVINIITKSARATQGVAITGGGGSQADSNAEVRFGGEARGAFYRLGAGNSVEAPLLIAGDPGQGASSPAHGWANRHADFRLDWNLSPSDSLVVSAGMFRSMLGSLLPVATVSSPGAPAANSQATTTEESVSARWQHTLSDTSNIEVRFSLDHLYRNDPQTSADLETFDYGFQHHVSIGSRNDLIWGFTLRNETFDSKPSAVLTLNPLNARRNEMALFAEDEIALVPNRVSLIVGTQISRASNIGYAVQPTARLLWTPSQNLSTWLAVSRAERTPSLDERGIDYYETPMTLPPPAPPLLAVVHLVGNPLERGEDVLAYEAGQRVQVSKRLSFDVSTFYNVYHHLTSAIMGTPTLQFSSGMPYLQIPTTFGNDRHGDAYGSELSTTWIATSRWRLNAGYSWVRVETRNYPGDVSVDLLRTSAATPHHQWELRSYFDLTPKVQIDTAFYYTAAMIQTGIPQHLRGDLRIGWRPIPKVELSLGVRDAFEPTHLEYLSTRYNQLAEVARNFYARLTWRF